MRSTLIENIIKNYTEQYRICEEMATLAAQQLALLKGTDQAGVSAQVMDIMTKRQRLLDDLQLLDTENRGLQEQALSELSISEFTLSQLKARLNLEQFSDFKGILNQLGIILKSISETDNQNQLLMREGLARISKSGPRVDNKAACSVYKQVMDLNKDNS